MTEPASNTASNDDQYQTLMVFRSGDQNDHYLASMYNSAYYKKSALNSNLGLSNAELKQLLDKYFPGNQHQSNDQALLSLVDDRLAEYEELVTLITAHRANRDQEELLIAKIIASACMGSDHLWQDLGLWCRKDLSEMIAHNFPELAEKNSANMKWKKFLYKQLCIQEGIYICRSPSCEVCPEYKECFAPEE